MAEIVQVCKVQYGLFGFRAYLTLQLERSPLSLVLLKGDIAVFSESGSGWALGTSRRQWHVLARGVTPRTSASRLVRREHC